MRVNFVIEFNALIRFCRNNALPLRERMLWISLFSIANDRAIYDEESQTYEWPEDFIPITNGELGLYSTLDKRAIDELRNSLKQRGVIDFLPGNKNARPPMYKIHYLSADSGRKNVPNNVPNNVPKDAPKDVPNERPRTYPNGVQGRTQQASKDVPNEAPFYKYNINVSENVDKGKERYERAKAIDGLVDMDEAVLSGGGLI